MKDHFTAQGIDITIYRQPRAKNLSAYFTINGKRVRIGLGTDNAAKARAAAREEVSKRLTNPENIDIQRKSFAMLVEDYLVSRWPDNPKGNYTYRDVRGRLRNMAKTQGGVLVSGLNLSDAIQFTQRLINRRTNGRTAVNDREVLRQFWRWCRREQVVAWAENPCASELLRMPRIEEPEPDPLSREAVQALMPAAKKNPVWPVFLLCLGAGCRPIEATRVEWSDIDLEQRIVKVVNHKGSRSRARTPSLNEWLVAEFKAMDRGKPKPFPFKRDTAFHMMQEVSQLAGVPATLQQLRQTACTEAILSGMTIADYVLTFGHTLAVAQRNYLRLGKSKTPKAMEALDFGKKNMNDHCLGDFHTIL